jgi:D-amino-acid dehydrogenase
MHVAVVGGGIIGLLCAHHLARRGARVTLVERARVGAGCSAGNAGWVTPSVSIPLPAPGLRGKSMRWMLRADSPLYIRPSAVPRLLPFLLGFWRHCNRRDFDRGVAAYAELAADTMALYDELEADGVVFEWAGDGLLMAFRDAADMAHEMAILDAQGYGPLRVLDSAELVALEPALRPPFAGGIHVLPERTVRPESVCAATAARLRRDHEVLEERPVRGLRLEGRRAVAAELADGAIEADAFVIATGAEAAALSRACGCPLPLQAGKGYSVTVEKPRVALRHPLYLGSIKVGITPFRGALRIAGTMELSGINLRLDGRRVAALVRGAESCVPGVSEGASRREWVGMRPITPDGLPILGRLPTTDNVYVATGHQMLGVTLAPATGRVMAELILEGGSSVDLAPFAVERFAP